MGQPITYSWLIFCDNILSWHKFFNSIKFQKIESAKEFISEPNVFQFKSRLVLILCLSCRVSCIYLSKQWFHTCLHGCLSWYVRTLMSCPTMLLIGHVNEYPTTHYFGNTSKKLHCGNVLNMSYYEKSYLNSFGYIAWNEILLTFYDRWKWSVSHRCWRESSDERL